MRDAVARLASGFSELLWPTRCAVCDTPGNVLCADCEMALPRIDRGMACPRCGAPYGWLICTECLPCYPPDGEDEQGCSGDDEGVRYGGRGNRRQSGACSDKASASPSSVPSAIASPAAPSSDSTSARPVYELARCACEYRDGAAKLVRVYKDGGERRLASTIARLMLEALPEEWYCWPDLLAFVPSTKAALSRRGFDHMELVAGSLFAQSGIPLVPVLARSAAKDQRALSREMRAANAQGTFFIPRRHVVKVFGAHVLLIDDVITTGATLNAASAALLAASAAAVRALAFARVW